MALWHLIKIQSTCGHNESLSLEISIYQWLSDICQWFECTYSRHSKHNTWCMCKWALVSKTPEEQQQSSHSGERMTDCVTETEKTQKRGEKEENRGTERRGVRGKKEQRGEERGRMTGNNFSLEERLHIEKLLSNNTGYIRVRTHTHKLPFPYLSSLCTVLHVLWQKFKPFACRLTDSSHFLVSFPLEFSSNLRPACSLTGINEPSERNATAEETNLMKMAAEIPEERLWKCVFIMKSFRLHRFEVKFG